MGRLTEQNISAIPADEMTPQPGVLTAGLAQEYPNILIMPESEKRFII